MNQSEIPTKGNLLAARNSLEMAKLGYDLLDKKRNVLIREIMEMNEEARAIQGRINTVFTEAYESFQAATRAVGKAEVWRTGLCIPIDNSTHIRERSVMGVLLPVVMLGANAQSTSASAADSMLATESAVLDVAYIKFQHLKELIAELSQVENSAYRLAMAIKKTQKRANALANIIIPKYESLVKYIAETLEERERDEFTRLKVIKASSVKSS